MKLADVMRQVGTKWSLWKFAFFAVLNALFSLACYRVGWLLSSKCDSMWVARFGAIATAAALLFAIYDHRSALQRSETKALERVRGWTDLLRMTGSKSFEEAAEQLKRNTVLVDRVVTWLQAIVLAVATLVWGFGDLATKLMPGVCMR